MPVFEWADVLLSATFLKSVKCSAKKTQKEVIIDLASAAGVYIQWDSSDKAKLCGKWANILKAQAIFHQYLSDQVTHGITEDKSNGTNSSDNSVSTVNCNQIKKEGVLKKVCLPVEQRDPTEEKEPVPTKHNEVYVNITISTSGFTDILSNKKNSSLHLTPKPNEKLHLIKKGQSSAEKIKLTNDTVNRVEVFQKILHKQENNNENKHFPSMLLTDCHTATSENLNISVASPDNTPQIVSDETENTHSLTSTQENDYQTVEVIKQEPIQNASSTTRQVEAHNAVGNERSESTDSDKNCDIQNLTNVSDNYSQTDKSKNASAANKTNNMPSFCHNEFAVIDTPSCNVQDDGNESSNTKKFSSDMKKLTKRRNYEELAPFKFFCSKCSFKSKRESHYQRHMQLHNQVSNIYECDKCSFRTIRLGNLRRHELTHSESELSCELCSYRTLDHKLLTRHQRTKHLNKHPEPEEKEVLTCPQCNYSTNRPRLLERHSKKHKSYLSGNELIYECSKCPYKAGRKQHLTRHINNVHGSHRPFLCHHCGKAFKRKDALKQHSAVHLSQPPFKCPTCDKGCRSQAHLKQHMAVHSARRLFLCELCGASFKTRAVQRKHIFSIHHHPKAYSCLHCSRRFNTKFALRRHMKQHFEKKQKSTSSESNTKSALKDGSYSTVHVVQPESSDNMRASTLKQSSTLVHNLASCNGQTQGEKMTVHIGNCNPDQIQIIPAQTFIQQANETATALLYLTGSFSSY